MISQRELVFRFFALSYPARMRVLVTLKLLDDSDTGIPDSELVKRAIVRARERDQLSDLMVAITAALAGQDSEVELVEGAFVEGYKE